jgi:hypothetical protein
MKRPSDTQHGLKLSVMDKLLEAEWNNIAKPRKLDLRIMHRDELEKFATMLNDKFNDSKFLFEHIYFLAK